jgi:hypothetical protein
MEDSRGVIRGACNACGCTQYYPDDRSWKCQACGHPPAKHQMHGARKTCRYPGCYAGPEFDLNTGAEKPWCPEHRGYNGPDAAMQVQDVEYYDDFSYGGGAQQQSDYQYTTGKLFSVFGADFHLQHYYASIPSNLVCSTNSGTHHGSRLHSLLPRTSASPAASLSNWPDTSRNIVHDSGSNCPVFSSRSTEVCHPRVSETQLHRREWYSPQVLWKDTRKRT